MPELILYHDYSRKEIHDIFSPDTNFTPGAGLWGISGIIQVPNRTGDFVFIVSYGSSQAGHDFNEPITTEGVIAWQSQPSQTLQNTIIKQLISHDELTNSIYLLLRTKKGMLYTYLGKLSYITHDTERESPVRFEWQILDWNIESEVLNRMGLTLAGEQELPTAPSGITITEPPQTPTGGTPTRNFASRRSSHDPARDARNKRLGQAGELLVVEEEKRLLTKAGREDLAEKVTHIAATEGDGAGYDVLSYSPTGNEKHIEIKTTRSGERTKFFITSNEVAFSRSHPETFYLYRLYNFNNTCSLMYVLHGDMNEILQLDPVNYRASIR